MHLLYLFYRIQESYITDLLNPQPQGEGLIQISAHAYCVKELNISALILTKKLKITGISTCPLPNKKIIIE